MKNLSRGGTLAMAVLAVVNSPVHAALGNKKVADKEVLVEANQVPAGLIANEDGGFDIPLSLDMFDADAAPPVDQSIEEKIASLVVTKDSVSTVEVVDTKDEITVKVADLKKLLPNGNIALLKTSAPPSEETTEAKDLAASEETASEEAADAGPEVVIVSETIQVVGETSPADTETVETATDNVTGSTMESVTETAEVADEAAEDLLSTTEQAAPEAAVESAEEAVKEVADQVTPMPAPEAKPPVVESPKEPSAIESIARAMKPETPLEPLKDRRFTAYISEKVFFTQVEQGVTKGKLENSRLHLATLYSEERDIVLQGGISLDSTWSKTLRLSFGARAYIALLGEENEDTFAAAVGTEAAYRIPFKAAPLEFSASLYYAPDIMTFGVGDRALDAKVQLAIPFRKNSALFTGIRYFQVDTQPEDREVDNRLHVGFRWNFE